MAVILVVNHLCLASFPPDAATYWPKVGQFSYLILIFEAPVRGDAVPI